ncbi:hypothetical protein AOZ06_19065 [Kibdelosporangium phytohabitans]|uniref:Uncharacterized protein n=2 Tax=Kibdelosporangium phytohabitans TaxID=860235 RepID=A0A0N9HYI2_9PSEU|nr:hypothetical protein AOZ06_19065 [Kibdelosporangium phytohabitans]
METQCGVSFRDPDLVLYHLIKDAAGTKALLYSGRSTVTCTIGGDPATPYNPGGGSVESFHWIPGDLAVDQISGSAGGSKQGKPGYWLTAGRISGKVARVTFTDGDETVDAVLANGTFLGRILQPAGWSPRNSEKVVVRAYDVDGQLVGESGHPGKPCYVTPLGTVLNRAREGNVNCLPATRWR